MAEWTYILQRSLEPLPSMNSVEPLSVRFELWHTDHCFVRGIVDWQDGVTLFHSEHIEPNEWSNMSICALAAIAEARTMIGENWDKGMADPA